MLERVDPLYFEKLRMGAFAMDNCRIYMAKMRAVEETLLQLRLEKKNKYQRLNNTYFKATLVTALIICITGIGFFFRELGIRLTAQKNLKSKINELRISNRELEEITFAASHDLQEPMRKVRILSNLMARKFAGKIDPSDLDVVDRINKITGQMQGMLNDLVLYTNLLNPKETFTEVNLYEIFRHAYNSVFGNEQVQFSISGQLPIIRGSEDQIEAMLVHLLDNSLKYKSTERALSLSVKYELLQLKKPTYFWHQGLPILYHKITITDNGIGFDNQYSDKIFGLFQRLHTQTAYPGKGIGLSVARRVMLNHKGWIESTGEKGGRGEFYALFSGCNPGLKNIYFPNNC